MLLLELFDAKVDYEVKKATSGQFKTQAEIGGRTIVFRAELDRGPKGEYWDVSFEEVNGFHATYAATGKGKAYEVLAMVKDSLIEFRDRYKPEIVYFTAEATNGSARANIYRKMVGQILSDYELEETKSADEHVFIYRRK